MIVGANAHRYVTLIKTNLTPGRSKKIFRVGKLPSDSSQQERIHEGMDRGTTGQQKKVVMPRKKTVINQKQVTPKKQIYSQIPGYGLHEKRARGN